MSVIAILGPTAVGKSSLAEALAGRLGGELVSADSMQVYRGMDIGTAKPDLSRPVPRYHCIDIADPGEGFSAALYQRHARTAIREISARGAMPILVGGTGLYVRAALDPMEFPAGELDSPARRALESEATRIGADALHRRLLALDPASAALIHPRNVRRTIRALEMAGEGRSYARQAAGFSRRESIYHTTFLGLECDRAELYRRIDERVDAMLAGGLLDEIDRLLAAGFRDALTASQAIGYKEFVPVIDRECDLDTAVESVKRLSRRYAKRQLSWFRADPRLNWLDVTSLGEADVLSAALELLESERLGTD